MMLALVTLTPNATRPWPSDRPHDLRQVETIAVDDDVAVDPAVDALAATHAVVVVGRRALDPELDGERTVADVRGRARIAVSRFVDADLDPIEVVAAVAVETQRARLARRRTISVAALSVAAAMIARREARPACSMIFTPPSSDELGGNLADSPVSPATAATLPPASCGWKVGASLSQVRSADCVPVAISGGSPRTCGGWRCPRRGSGRRPRTCLRAPDRRPECAPPARSARRTPSLAPGRSSARATRW